MKAVGHHQWYWRYEYSDFWSARNQAPLEFDSFWTISWDALGSGHKHHSPLYARPRLRGGGGGDKSPRSEDQEADDEQGDKTDNDHDSLNLSQSSSVVSMVAVGERDLLKGLSHEID
jgi:hypothetical protein